MKGKGKGIKYILGIATMAFCSVFTVGCGEAKITGIVTDGDDIQLTIDLGSSLNGNITAELKQQIFEQLAVQTQMSDGKKVDIEWDAEKVSISLDESETKKWGEDTGVFKFRLTYDTFFTVFKVQVNTVPAGLSANLNQSATLDSIVAAGGDRMAVESQIAVSLTERTGFTQEGVAEYNLTPLTTDVQRSNLTFEWFAADAQNGISAMPTVDKVPAGKYKVRVSYQLPASTLIFNTEEIIFEVLPATAATFTGVDNDYGKIETQNINLTEQSGTYVCEISGLVKYEPETDDFMENYVGMDCGNIATLNLVAPAGFLVRDTSSANIKLSYSTDGVEWDTVYNKNQEADPFILGDSLSVASTNILLNFKAKTDLYKVEIKWNNQDEVKTYTIKLSDNAVLEEPAILGYRCEWLGGSSYKSIAYNRQHLDSELEHLANNVSVVCIREDGEVLIDMEGITVSYADDFDVRVVGLYDVYVSLPQNIPGLGDTVTLKVKVEEPELPDFEFIEDSLSANLEKTVDENNNVIISGKFGYHYATNAGDELIYNKGVESGYIIPLSVSNSNYITYNEDATLNVWKSVGDDWVLIQNTIDGAFLDDESDFAKFDLLLSAQSIDDKFKIEVKWCDFAPISEFIIELDQNKTELQYGAVTSFAESYAYDERVTFTQFGGYIEVGGVVPLKEANAELSMAKENVVSFRINAPKTIAVQDEVETLSQLKHNENGKVVVYKNTEIYNTLKQNTTITNYDVFGYIAQLGEIAQFGTLVGTGTLDSTDGEDAFVDVYLGMELQEVFFVGVDWNGDDNYIYYAVCLSDNVKLETASITSFDFATTYDTISYGTSAEEVIKNIRAKGTATITSSDRADNYVTNDYSVVLKDGQTFNSKSVGTEYTYVVTYLGSAEGQVNVVKEITLTVSNPISPVSTVLKDVTASNEFGYYSLSIEENWDASNIKVNVNGCLPYVKDGNDYINAFNFKIYAPVIAEKYTDLNTILPEDLKQIEIDNEFTVRYYSQDENSVWGAPEEWTGTSATALIKNGNLDTVFTMGANVGEEVQLTNCNYVDWQMNITDFSKPFKIEITWATGITFTYEFDLTNASAEEDYNQAELMDSVRLTYYEPGAWGAYQLLENEETANTVTDYILDGAFPVAEQEEGNNRIEISIKSPETYANIYEEVYDEGKDAVVFDIKETGYAEIYFDDTLYVRYNSLSDFITQLYEFENEELVLSDNFGMELNIPFNDCEDADYIRVSIKWSGAHLPVDYVFDITKLINQVATNTTIVSVDGSELRITDLNEVVINSGLEKQTEGEYAGKYTQTLRFTSQVPINLEEAQIVIFKSDDGFNTYINSKGERLSIGDITDENGDDFIYEYAYGSDFLDTSGATTYSMFQKTFVFDEFGTAYLVNVTWAKNTEVETYIVRMGSGGGFLIEDGIATKNTFDNTYATSNDVEFVEKGCVDSIDTGCCTYNINKYKITGEVSYESSKYGVGDNFVVGVTISKPASVTDISNSVVAVTRKNGGSDVWEGVNSYTMGSANDNDSQITVFLRAFSKEDEFIIVVDWDGNPQTISQEHYTFLTSEGGIYTQYFHFSFADDVKFNLPEATVSADSLLNETLEHTVTKTSDYNYEIGGHLERKTLSALENFSGFVASVKISENKIIALDGTEQSVATTPLINCYVKDGEDWVKATDDRVKYLMNKNGSLSYYFYFALQNRDDEYKIEITWCENALYNTQTYYIGVNGNAEFCAAGEIGAVQPEDNNGYAVIENNVSINKNVEDEVDQITFSGEIPYSEENYDLTGTANAGNFVGVYFEAPEGISAQNAVIKVAKRASSNSSWSTYSNLTTVVIPDGATKVYYYALMSNVSEQYKVVVFWNECYQSQELIINLASDATFALGPATITTETGVDCESGQVGSQAYNSYLLSGALKTAQGNKIVTDVILNAPTILSSTSFENAVIEVKTGVGSGLDWQEATITTEKLASGYKLGLEFDALTGNVRQYQVTVKWDGSANSEQTYFFSLDTSKLDLVIEEDYTLNETFALLENVVWTVKGKLTIGANVGSFTILDNAVLRIEGEGCIENYDSNIISNSGLIYGDNVLATTSSGVKYMFGNLASALKTADLNGITLQKSISLTESSTVSGVEIIVASGVTLNLVNALALDSASSITLHQDAIIINYTNLTASTITGVNATSVVQGQTFAYNNLQNALANTNATNISVVGNVVLTASDIFTVNSGVEVLVGAGATLDLSALPEDNIIVDGLVKTNGGTIILPDGYSNIKITVTNGGSEEIPSE